MELHQTSKAQTIGRIILGLILLTAGIGHLSWARVEFLAQVPDWVPLNGDLVVILSGIVEISMGLSLIFWSSQRVRVGWLVALFFVLVFPGNVSQLITHTNAFGLNSDLLRGIRLLFQPVLVIWALWSTGAWAAWRKK
ncbi:putative membrane protein [Pedobacter cryoconitis]|uniref:Putative membrane protein n=1 Tax=Pedobacter cryoconitis TaxID=188932 RepID=A0A7W8YPJ3_9SPHI|nr:hypothetical protein [Pedobacter cryoconitis]MBB5619411.1 putative membrane protein [Pedobacter cryoconitis]